MSNTNIIKGGEFLIKDIDCESVFIPEDFQEEDQMFAQSCDDFLKSRVFPNLDAIDKKEAGLMEALLEEAGEMGLLGFTVPEDEGGLGQSYSSAMLVNEVLGAGHSFAVSYAAHIGIGMASLVFYGNKEQKEKYLPEMITAQKKAAYCLTEPGAGSDANSIKSKAVLSDDGTKYIINGQKMWITNGGFADVYIVFARIDGDKGITAFIVESNYKGFKRGAEEPKMGIKGSSTVQLFFEDCEVPVENILGEREAGFKMALNILNLGRMKLAGAASGAAKSAINHALTYSLQRKQFGQAVANFGAIKFKLAEQSIRLFAIESALYRVTKNVDEQLHKFKSEGKNHNESALSAHKEYAIEAAIMKVYASEMLDYVVDEGVQIMGGMGYSTEAPLERSYRDSRINRIFEGTNEINRLLVVDMLIKRAMKGELDLLNHAQAVVKDLTSLPDFGEKEEALLSHEKDVLKNFKKAALLVAGAAVQKLGMKLSDEQEILMNLSNIISEVYIAESVLLRAEKLHLRDYTYKEQVLGMAQTYIYDAADRINKQAKDAVNSFMSGDEQRMILLGVKRYTKINSLNVKDIRRKIANLLIEKEKYPFF